MKNLPINPNLIKNTKTLEFINIPSMYNGFTDVMYQNERIAILNGLSSPLQWALSKKSKLNVPIEVIKELENLVQKWIKETNSNTYVE